MNDGEEFPRRQNERRRDNVESNYRASRKEETGGVGMGEGSGQARAVVLSVGDSMWR